MDPKLERITIAGYEEVYKVTEPDCGLVAIIAIHSTQMGPALGGVRVYPYQSFDDALEDVLRLSKGMTYKALLAEAGLGGGKSVIIWDPSKPIPGKLLRAYAKAVNQLNGRYFTSEDSGITPNQLLVIREESPYVVGIEHSSSSGNPSPFTAWGVFKGIQAALHHKTGSSLLEGRTIAIQGLGCVGSLLAEHLFWHGADLIVTDTNRDKVEIACRRFDARAATPEEIYDVKCDVFSPCALGSTINEKTIKRLQCKAVAGCANNQLQKPEDAALLTSLNILYAPDYIINSGGLINVQFELSPGGYRPVRARDAINKIYDRLSLIFTIAEKNNCSTEEAAKALADHKLKFNIGKRNEKIALSP